MDTDPDRWPSWIATPPPSLRTQHPSAAGQAAIAVPAGLPVLRAPDNPRTVWLEALRRWQGWHPAGLLHPQERPYAALQCVTPMNGTEPEPRMPPSAEQLGQFPADWWQDDPQLALALHTEHNRIAAEVRTVHLAWQIYRYVAAVHAELLTYIPRLNPYQEAVAAARTAYEALNTTGTAQWCAALLHLSQARAAAITAAEQVAQAAGNVGYLAEQHLRTEAAREEAPDIWGISRRAGLNIDGWPDDDGDDLVYNLRETFRIEDEHLRFVTANMPPLFEHPHTGRTERS